MSPVRYGQTYRIELSFKQETGPCVMCRIVIVILIYHRHKSVDLIYRNTVLECTYMRVKGRYIKVRIILTVLSKCSCMSSESK
jgi:hypothetical protein